MLGTQILETGKTYEYRQIWRRDNLDYKYLGDSKNSGNTILWTRVLVSSGTDILETP